MSDKVTHKSPNPGTKCIKYSNTETTCSVRAGKGQGSAEELRTASRETADTCTTVRNVPPGKSN